MRHPTRITSERGGDVAVRDERRRRRGASSTAKKAMVYQASRRRGARTSGIPDDPSPIAAPASGADRGGTAPALAAVEATVSSPAGRLTGPTAASALTSGGRLPSPPSKRPWPEARRGTGSRSPRPRAETPSRSGAGRLTWTDHHRLRRLQRPTPRAPGGGTRDGPQAGRLPGPDHPEQKLFKRRSGLRGGSARS
jgi:hypothetical protein